MKLSKVNNVLLALIILIDGYIIVGPLVPAIIFHIEGHTAKRHELTTKIHSTQKPAAAKPQANQLIVPSMLLDQPIYDGPASQQYQILNKGIWRFNTGNTPDKGGNTILIGHRFTYTNPRGVFYYLNKVKMGDEIGVWWNNKEYLYKVNSISEVLPTDTAIEKNTTQPELTLFTCTPLWLPKDRLVIVANLETTP
jgi:sortase A